MALWPTTIAQLPGSRIALGRLVAEDPAFCGTGRPEPRAGACWESGFGPQDGTFYSRKVSGDS